MALSDEQCWEIYKRAVMVTGHRATANPQGLLAVATEAAAAERERCATVACPDCATAIRALK